MGFRAAIRVYKRLQERAFSQEVRLLACS